MGVMSGCLGCALSRVDVRWWCGVLTSELSDEAESTLTHDSTRLKNTQELNDHILCSDENQNQTSAVIKSDTDVLTKLHQICLCIFQSANSFSWVIRAAGGILKSRKGGEELCSVFASQHSAGPGKASALPWPCTLSRREPGLGIRAFVCVRMWDCQGVWEFYITSDPCVKCDMSDKRQTGVAAPASSRQSPQSTLSQGLSFFQTE